MYRLLLLLYPSSFRAEYGEEMCRDFARKRQQASGFFAFAVLWMLALGDAVRNGLAAHCDLLWQDMRYASRTIRRAPGFAATAVLVAGAWRAPRGSRVYVALSVFTAVSSFRVMRLLPFHAMTVFVLVAPWLLSLRRRQMEFDRESSFTARDWIVATVVWAVVVAPFVAVTTSMPLPLVSAPRPARFVICTVVVPLAEAVAPSSTRRSDGPVPLSTVPSLSTPLLPT